MTSKTPSAILNDIAKKNNISPEYIPCEQSGLPHQRTFMVKLMLPGVGEYQGLGPSIKDAKNAAANTALQNGIFNSIDATKQIIKMSPTVELNILSMRAREEIRYLEKDPIHIRNTLATTQIKKPGIDNKKFKGNPMLLKQFIKIWNVSVHVCGKTFDGQGITKQDARNDAACNALEAIRSELIMKSSKHVFSQSNHDDSQSYHSSNVQQDRNKIIQLNELACMNKMRPKYEVIQETGPPHIMKFVVKCMVNDKETVGEGIGKKAAKLEAAKKMIDLLMNSEDIKNKVNSTQDERSSKQKKPGKHKKKKQKSEKIIDINHDPVTYLTQLLQMRKEPMAVYTCIAKQENKHDERFEIEVRVGGTANLVATGIASTKKEAKMMAADNLLKKCGIDREKIKEQIRESENEVKKAYMSAVIGMPRTASNPGDIVVENKAPVRLLHKAPGGPVNSRMNWPNGDAGCLSITNKLEQILDTEGVKMMFIDDTKKNDSEQNMTHLAIVTSPPIVFQGTGDSVEESRNDSVTKAFAHIEQYGLNRSEVKAEKDI